LTNPQITDGERAPNGSPISPGCTVGATTDQSVTVNGIGGIFISDVLCWRHWHWSGLQRSPTAQAHGAELRSLGPAAMTK
jgi:hypothetical protein